MKKLIVLFLVCWSIFPLVAQQAPQFSTYMLNPYAYNPAVAGTEATLIGNLAYRKQWTDFPGAPETAHFNAHLPFNMLSSGLGIQIETDALGAHRLNRAALSYSYHVPFSRKAQLSMGLSAGFLQYRLDGSLLRAPEGTYENGAFLHNDDFLPKENAQASTPFVEFGLYLRWQNFNLGFSALPIYAPMLKFAENNGINVALKRHYIATTSYSFDIGEGHSLRPSLLLKTDGTQTQIEISSVFSWKGNITIGTSFRGVSSSARDALVLLTGFRINPKTTLTYAYDLPLSPLKAANRGSHEVLLKYDLGRTFGKGYLPPIVHNPRFY